MKKLYLYSMLMAVVVLSGAVGAAETTKSGQTSYIVMATGDADSVVARLKVLQETDFLKLTHPPTRIEFLLVFIMEFSGL